MWVLLVTLLNGLVCTYLDHQLFHNRTMTLNTPPDEVGAIASDDLTSTITQSNAVEAV